MKVRNETNHYYTAFIWRGARKVMRQGTIHADDPLEAIDRVYELAKDVWEREVSEITILDPMTGQIKASSTNKGDLRPAVKNVIGDVAGRLKSIPQLPGPAAKKEEDKEGFVPWDKQYKKQFLPVDIGTYFRPKTFKTIVR